MTYGWALLVVLIAIAALAFFGLLNPQRFLPEKCELGSGLTCLEFAASGTGNINGANVTLILNNGIGQPMYDIWLNVSVCGNGLNRTGQVNTTPATGCQVSNTNLTANAFNFNNCAGGALIPSLSEGQTARVYINCTNGILGTPNSRFKSDILINYSTITEGQALSHTKKGFIVVQVQ
jgi:hypothetical protein